MSVPIAVAAKALGRQEQILNTIASCVDEVFRQKEKIQSLSINLCGRGVEDPPPSEAVAIPEGFFCGLQGKLDNLSAEITTLTGYIQHLEGGV